MLLSTDAHVRIIDRPCGFGKTTQLLRSFQPDRRYLVVVPLLTEVDRVINEACVPFHEPQVDSGVGTKADSLEMLLKRGVNIVTTHQLYRDIVFLAKAGLLDGYDIYVDEVPEVLSSYGEVKPESLREFYLGRGYAIISPEGQLIPTEKWHQDHELVSDTLKENLYRLAASGMLYVVDDTFLIWAYPQELLRAGRSFTVMTYQARGSLLLPYLDRCGIPYVHDVDPVADLRARQDAARLIELRGMPRLKKLKLSYSGQTRAKAEERELVSRALLGLRRGDLRDVPLESVLITCAKDNWYAGGKGPKDVAVPKQGPYAKGSKLFEGVSWIPNTTRGTNDYAHASHLIYLYDQYPNPAFLRFLGLPNVTEAQDRYALAELLQVIYRTRVRKAEPVVVYLPSDRMRRLLDDHLERHTLNMVA